MDQAVDGDLDPGGVADVVGGLAGDVARGAVVELGGDHELLVQGPGRREPLGREDPERPDPGRRGPIIAATRGDPAQQGLGLDRSAGKPQAALVGYAGRRLQEGQAPLRRQAVDAPAELVVGQRLEIEVRIVAPQAEPEAALAAQVAVAGPHVAAGLRKQRDDVGAEARRPMLRRVDRRGSRPQTDRPPTSPEDPPLPSACGRTTPCGRDRRYRRRLHDEPAVAGHVAERAVRQSGGHGELLATVRTREDDGCRLDAQAWASPNRRATAIEPENTSDRDSAARPRRHDVPQPGSGSTFGEWIGTVVSFHIPVHPAESRSAERSIAHDGREAGGMFDNILTVANARRQPSRDEA